MLCFPKRVCVPFGTRRAPSKGGGSMVHGTMPLTANSSIRLENSTDMLILTSFGIGTHLLLILKANGFLLTFTNHLSAPRRAIGLRGGFANTFRGGFAGSFGSTLAFSLEAHTWNERTRLKQASKIRNP